MIISLWLVAYSGDIRAFSLSFCSSLLALFSPSLFAVESFLTYLATASPHDWWLSILWRIALLADCSSSTLWTTNHRRCSPASLLSLFEFGIKISQQ